MLVEDETHVVNGNLYVTGGVTTTAGIYTASFALTGAATPLTTLFDIWSSAAGGTEYHTGSFQPTTINLQPQNPATTFVTNITNLKPVYHTTEVSRFVYTRAVATVPPFIVESGSFSVTRVVDGLQAISFGTGSNSSTQMSYDVSGSYFDLDMGLLEPGYAYELKFAYYNGTIGDWQEQPPGFKFRVEEG